MTLAQYSLARYARQLRDESQTRPLSKGECDLLDAIERDIVRWEKIRQGQDGNSRHAQVPAGASAKSLNPRGRSLSEEHAPAGRSGASEAIKERPL